MSTLINTYPVFENSQVLTSSQLNQLVSYLDQQNRLTRVRLIGRGIVCGLKLDFEQSGAAKEISISKGSAVTSEGFLIAMGDCTANYYRPYTLPEGVSYKPFGDPDQDVTLFELLAELPDDTSDVEPLNTPGTFLDDKFVLLFVEIFDNDLRSCLSNSCDELGIDRIFTLRKLLISKDDLDVVLTRSSNVNDLYPDRLNLPAVGVPAVLFDAENAHSSDESAFYQNFADAINTSVFDTLFASGGALSQSYEVYQALLEQEYDFNNPFEDATVQSLVSDWKDYVDGASAPGETHAGIQYFYDFVKDVVLAYDEFRHAAFDLMSECCTDMSRFPKHVMLGRALIEDQTEEEAADYRHGFSQPPIYNLQQHLEEQTISLHKRLVAMLESFNLERVNVPESGEEAGIRITPSMEKVARLSHRSVPFYYDLEADNALAGGTLAEFWNHERTRKQPTGTFPLTHGYYSQSEDQSTPVSALETPLYFDHENYPFLRIEGHIGTAYEDALSTINDLRSAFDLPIDTLALQLDEEAELLEADFSCGFEDLQEEYVLSRSNICGLTGELGQLLDFIVANQEQVFGDDEDVEGDLQALAEIVTAWKVMCESMPDCLQDFQFEQFQSAYKEFLHRTLDFILVRKELLDEIDIRIEDSDEETPVINGLIQRVAPVFFRLVDMLWYHSLLKVYYGFRRRAFYKQRQAAVFSGYIQNHPGITHQAGVPKGGTFILVYSGEEEQEVIADFALPYRCCATDLCVPMCDDEDGFRLEIPPMARPDYGVTLTGQAIEINVTLNDSGFLNAEYQVEVSGDTEQGGRVEALNELGLLMYTPREGFAGYDRFEYQLTDRVSGQTDTGTVHVLVKSDQQTGGCYSIPILQSWGINFVFRALRDRDIDPGNMSAEVALSTLLAELRRTRGFTSDEIRFEVLEGEEARRGLLTAIGIAHTPNTTYDELERLILQYQQENCGGEVVEAAACYTLEILNCWNPDDDRVRDTLKIRGLDAGGIPEGDLMQSLLDELRRTRGFSNGEVQDGILNDEVVREQLVNCLQLNPDGSAEYEEQGRLILQYQQDNCGQQGGFSGRRIVLSANELNATEARRILGRRGTNVGSNASENELRSALANTGSGMNIATDELRGFTNNRLNEILQGRGVTVSSSATKADLINALLRSGQ